MKNLTNRLNNDIPEGLSQLIGSIKQFTNHFNLETIKSYHRSYRKAS